MNNDYPDTDHMLAYIEGRLSPEASRKLEEMIAQDKGLALEIEELRLYAASQSRAKEAHVAHEQTVRDTIPMQRRATSSRLVAYVAAASVLLMAAIGFLFMERESPQEKAMQYMAWDHDATLRGEGGSADVRKGLEAGDAGDWDTAIQFFDQAIARQPNRDEPYLYKALALVQTGKSMQAGRVLSDLLAQSEMSNAIRTKAHWYRALTYLLVDDCASARPDLEKVIQREGNVIANQAKDLLEGCE